MNERQLAEYLERIGHGWNVRPDLETLRSLHRAHLEAIPFEALDVQLGRQPSLEPDAIFDKLVGQRRGGWCYEMNGLFGRALERIGFEVVRVSCGVMRHVGGEERMGTHLALLVRLGGEDWLADVGFGSSLVEPIPLAGARHDHRPFEVGLARTDDGHWRFSEYASGEPFSFDFRAEQAVHLVAPAAAPLLHELVEDGAGFHRRDAAGLRVERFERDCLHVAAM